MEIFHESKDVYLLKDMEKEAPEKKGDKVFSPEVPPWCRFHQHSTMVHASPAWYHQHGSSSWYHHHTAVSSVITKGNRPFSFDYLKNYV